MDDPSWGRPLNAGGRGEHELIPAGLDATLVLLRHGESEYIVEGRFQGQADTPLSPVGLRQAALAGQRLARPHASPTLPVPSGSPLEVVHSPLRRTAQTAAAVATAGAVPTAFGHEIPLRPEPGFLEIGQGEWEGLHHTVISERYADVLRTWRHTPLEAWAPGGESLPEVQARVRPALVTLLGTLAAAGEPGTLDRPQVQGFGEAPRQHPWSVLVAHDGVFKVTLLTLFGLPLDRFWMWLFDLCGISVIEFRAGRPVARAHNLTEHLAPLLDERAQQASEARQKTGAL